MFHIISYIAMTWYTIPKFMTSSNNTEYVKVYCWKFECTTDWQTLVNIQEISYSNLVRLGDLVQKLESPRLYRRVDSTFTVQGYIHVHSGIDPYSPIFFSGKPIFYGSPQGECIEDITWPCGDTKFLFEC